MDTVPVWAAAIPALIAAAGGWYARASEYRRTDRQRSLDAYEQTNNVLLEFAQKRVQAIEAELVTLREEISVERRARVVAEEKNIQLSVQLDNAREELHQMRTEITRGHRERETLLAQVASLQAVTGVTPDRRQS